MKHITVIHGPNLNMLGSREAEIYGSIRLEDINQRLTSLAGELEMELRIIQTNHEGEMVESIQEAKPWADAIIINPAAFTHTSVAILDALKSVGLPAVEVHLTNVYARETFRHRSYIAGAVAGRIMGFGAESYLLALRAIQSILEKSALS
ncbi:type II 3-dehydroquinate dehydratase [candidate division FCPU426 bacterium]|nr:type II 3-dehydroquinate dehydratase [candidate division FCPU426 bacterium]